MSFKRSPFPMIEGTEGHKKETEEAAAAKFASPNKMGAAIGAAMGALGGGKKKEKEEEAPTKMDMSMLGGMMGGGGGDKEAPKENQEFDINKHNK